MGERLKFLDGLRGIAILAVVGYHFFSPYNDFLKWGYLGVQLFFMISGYVIFMTLERCHTLGEFLLKRWIRLFPAMLAGSLFIFVAAHLIPSYAGPHRWTDLLPGLTFLEPAAWEHLFPCPFKSLDPAFWTLYIEVKFYLLAGVLYFLCKRENALTALLLFGALAYLAYQMAVLYLPDAYFDTLYATRKVLMIDWLPWFCVGASLHRLKTDGFRPLSWGFLIASAVGAILIPVERNQHSLVLLALFAAPFVISAANRLLSSRPLVFVGLISYPLYLVHQQVGWALIKALRPALPPALEIAANLAVALFLMALSAAFVWGCEKPAQRFLKNQWLSKPAAPASSAAKAKIPASFAHSRD